MSRLPTAKTLDELTQESILRLVAYTDQITNFSEGSTDLAYCRMAASLARNGDLHYRELYRRFTLMNATGDTLEDVAAEYGSAILSGARSQLWAILVPETFVVTIIADAGPITNITVASTTPILIGDSIRIRNGDGSTSETATVTGATPTVITTATLINTAAYAADLVAGNEVMVLFRATVPVGTTLASQVGVNFETLEEVITGDANPIMAGENAALALLDKTRAEATTATERGNIDPRTITGITPAIRGVRSAFNPAYGEGGTDSEDESSLRYRAAHGPTKASQGTLSWYTATAQGANEDILRVVMEEAVLMRTVNLEVLNRSGAGFSVAQTDAIAAYIQERIRDNFTVVVGNITMTAITVTAVVTLTRDGTLEGAFRSASSKIAAYLDYRIWSQGESVLASTLLTNVRNAEGVQAVEVASFLPAADVTVADDSFPTLVGVSMQDKSSGRTINATLTMSF